MWQCGPLIFKTQKVLGTTLPHRQGGKKLYKKMAMNHYCYGLDLLYNNLIN
jgi:hypothetical protein